MKIFASFGPVSSLYEMCYVYPMTCFTDFIIATNTTTTATTTFVTFTQYPRRRTRPTIDYRRSNVA